MSSPDEVIARIDGVVEAWERGPDAMRWTGRAPETQARTHRWTSREIADEYIAFRRRFLDGAVTARYVPNGDGPCEQ